MYLISKSEAKGVKLPWDFIENGNLTEAPVKTPRKFNRNESLTRAREKKIYKHFLFSLKYIFLTIKTWECWYVNIETENIAYYFNYIFWGKIFVKWSRLEKNTRAWIAILNGGAKTPLGTHGGWHFFHQITLLSKNI